MKFRKFHHITVQLFFTGLQDALSYAVLWMINDDDYDIRKMVAENILEVKEASLLLFEGFLDKLNKSGKKHVISKLRHKLVSLNELCTVTLTFPLSKRPSINDVNSIFQFFETLPPFLV